jgi:hypothetical protein
MQDLPQNGEMMTRRHELKELMRAISLTEDVEIDCSTCFDSMPAYGDHEVSGGDEAPRTPALRQHLALCRDCFEEYEALVDLVRLDAGDGLPNRSALLRQLAGG